MTLVWRYYRVRHKSINTPLSHERLVGGLQDGGRGTHVTHFVQLYPQPLYTASQVRTACRSWDEGVLTDVCLTGVLTDLCLTRYKIFYLTIVIIYFISTRLTYNISTTIRNVFVRCTDTRRLTTGILSEKCVFRWTRRCAKVYLHKFQCFTMHFFNSIIDKTPTHALFYSTLY